MEQEHSYKREKKPWFQLYMSLNEKKEDNKKFLELVIITTSELKGTTPH